MYILIYIYLVKPQGKQYNKEKRNVKFLGDMGDGARKRPTW